MDGFTCPACGEGEIVNLARPGRAMRYRQIPALELPAELEIPTCEKCGEEWLDAEATERVEKALEAAYRHELTRRGEQAISRLRAKIPQRDLERLVGVSAGLFSKIRSGKDTSPTLTSLLMLLADQPALVASLERLWATGLDAPSDRGEIQQSASLRPPPAPPAGLYLVPKPQLNEESPSATMTQVPWTDLAA